MSLDYFSPDGLIVWCNNTVTPVSDRHPDDCTSVKLDSLRPGATFTSVTGFRGMTCADGTPAGIFVLGYDNGEIRLLPRGTPVWEHVWGGWPAANALPRPHTVEGIAESIVKTGTA